MGVTLKLVDFPLTDARILALSRDNPGYRFERMPTGELHVTPTGGEAGRRNSALIAQLHAWNSVSERGIVFDSSTGFVLPDGSLYAPDAAWLARDRWNALTPEQREQFLPLCPDAAFEIASPSDRPDVLRTKMRLYIMNGAALAVLIDPYARSVELYRRGRDPEALQGTPRVTPGDPLSGFVLELGRILD